MDNTTLQTINDLLSKNDKIGIAVPKNPDMDQMAAALALYLSIKEVGKSVSIASPTEPIVAISSLVGINKVKTTLTGEGGDLVVAFPYKEGEIDKVSYTLEDGYLNIIVKTGEQGLSFKEQDVEYKRSGGMPTLLFVIGATRLNQLGELFNPEALKDTTVVNIDNKVENQGYGDVVLVSQDFSSISEQVSQLLLSLDLPLDQDTAQNLLSGISYATENFQSPKTSYVAFETAGILMRKGAQRARLQAVQTQNNQPQQVQNRPQMQGQQRRMPQFPRQGNGARQSYQQPQQVQHRQEQPRQERPQQQQPQELAQQAQLPAQPAQEDSSKQPPSDWLEPKVYKGSTPL